MTLSDQDPHRPGTVKNPDHIGDDPKQKMERDARDAKADAGAKAKEKAETGKHRVADEADALSDAIDAAASNLEDQDREGLARHAREMSSYLSDAAQQLEQRSANELASDAKRLAHKNPAMFMLGSVALGFGLSRFFRASAHHHHDSPPSGATGQSRDQNPAGTYGTSTPPTTAGSTTGAPPSTGTAAPVSPNIGSGRDTL